MVRERPGGTVVEVRVIPRAAKSMLAGVLDLPARALLIVPGEHARHKQVLVVGLGADDVRARLRPRP